MAAKTHVALQTSDPATLFRLYAAQVALRDNMLPPPEKDGESAIKNDHALMVRLNRDMYLNNVVYRAVIKAVVTAVIGEDGVELAPKAEPDLREKIKRRWLRWAAVADYAGRLSFTELERMALTELLVTGSLLIVKRTMGGQTLQLVETERIRKIVTDPATGRITGFLIDNQDGGDPVPLDAQDAIYLALTDRPSQLSGLGILWSCCTEINMLAFILRALAKSWAISARYAVTIETKHGKVADAVASDGLGVDADADFDVGHPLPKRTAGKKAPPPPPVFPPAGLMDGRIIDVDDGLVVMGKIGEKVNVVSHDGVPGSGLAEHVQTYLRVITSVIQFDAAAVVLNDYTQTSYSSSRARNAAQSRTVRQLQNMFQYQFYNHVGHWLMGGWAGWGEFAGVSYQTLSDTLAWNFPSPQTADAKTEIEADGNEIERCVSLLDEKIRGRNKDPEDHMEARVQELIRADQLVERVKEATGGRVVVPWQHFAGMPVGKTESAVVAARDAAPAPAPDPAPEEDDVA